MSIGKKNFFPFGEVLDSRAKEDIARFIGRNTNDRGDEVGVDAALDYPLFITLKPVVKGLAAPEALVGMDHRRKLVEQAPQFQVLHSNKTASTASGAVRQAGDVTVNKVDGSVGHGPLHVLRVTLQPMEV